MISIVEDNFNDIYKQLIQTITKDGKIVEPRKLKCFEISPGGFQLTDIRRSLLTLKERKLSYEFNAAEKLCYITGKSGEDILPKYAPKIKQFINKDTGKFDGAYGPRLIKQYEHILSILKKDKDTRQAILNIYNFHDDHHDSIDIPCTSTLHFLIRDNVLNLIVYMRSNDLLWGTPYDVAQFTFLQECFANILGIEPGTYTHIAGSLHIYFKDYERFEKILKCGEIVDKKYQQKPVNIKTWEQLQDQSKMVLRDEPFNNQFDFENTLIPYFKNLHSILYE